MAVLGEPLIQIGESSGASHGHRIGKVLALLTVILGLACATMWALGKNEQQADSATNMATLPTMMQLPKAPMQPARARTFMQPIQAAKSPIEGLVEMVLPMKQGEIDIVMPLTRRDMMAGLGAAATAALPLAANAKPLSVERSAQPPTLKKVCTPNPAFPKLCDNAGNTNPINQDTSQKEKRAAKPKAFVNGKRVIPKEYPAATPR